MPGLALGLSVGLGGGKAGSTLWDGLLEYIPLSESSAGSAPVERAGSYLGTRWTDAANAPSTTGHVHARAANFTQASSQYLYRTDYRLNPTGSFTFAAWARRIENDAEGYRFILSAGKYNLFLTHDCTLVSDLNAVNYHNADFDGIPMTRETWHLCRCWYDAEAGAWNNQLDLGVVGTWEAGAPEASNETLVLGARGGETPDKFWGGDIGPVMWWNRVLTDAEWSELYNNGAGVAYAGPAAAAEWAPTAIDDCALWLDAFDLDATGNLNNGVANGSAVTTWKDKSGNGRDMAQSAAGLRPLYRLDLQVGSLPYRPTVQFANSQLFNAAALSDTAGTVFAVLKTNPTYAYQGLVSAGDEAAGDSTLFLLGPNFDAGKAYIYQSNNDTGDYLIGDTAIENDIGYVMVWQSTGSAYALRVSGMAQTLTAVSGANTGDWFGDITGADNLAVGSWRGSSNFFYFTGVLAELLIYSRALSAAEIATVEAYLTAKWGLALS